MLIYVSYATPESQVVIELTAFTSITAGQAIINSGILKSSNPINLDDFVIGIYGKKCSTNTELKEFDRVEIYRPLLLTPVEARKLRAENIRK